MKIVQHTQNVCFKSNVTKIFCNIKTNMNGNTMLILHCVPSFAGGHDNTDGIQHPTDAFLTFQISTTSKVYKL